MVPTAFMAASVEMDSLGMTVVTTHSEKAAAYMADGYARARGAPGVCHAQNIGAANLAAGLRDAFMAGSPVIALTGGMDPMTSHRHLYQEIEDFPLFKPVTKASAQLHDARRLPDMLRQLFRDATTGAPGPVHLEVDGATGHVLDVDIEVPEFNVSSEAVFSSVPALRARPDDDQLVLALEKISRAQRPVIVAGGGVRWSGAQQALLSFAQKVRIPVATSMNAKGSIDEHHELALGVVGSSSRASANKALMKCDLAMFVGSRTGSQVTDGWRLPSPGTDVIQLDLDPAELGRNYPNAVSLYGDARLTLERLTELASDPGDVRAQWIDAARNDVASWREEKVSRLASTARPIRPERLCAELNRVMSSDCVLVSDTGHAGIWMASMMDLKPPQRFLRCAGSLGWALPAAIGAQCALPNNEVVCFTGDGGFYYHLAELETAVRYDIPVVVVVNDNRSLSQDIAPYGNANRGSSVRPSDKLWKFEDVDLAEIARNMGALAWRVEDPSDLAGALREALSSRRTAVIDVVTEMEAFPDPPYGGRAFYAQSDEAT
jgi:acetolactate synthase-1/2/3 large subunit